MKKKLLFIHLAKTGGASIRKMLNSSTLKFDYDCIHNGKLISFQNEKINRNSIINKISIDDYEYTAYFVRDPYTRLLSCYKYFYNGGLNQYNTTKHLGDIKTQKLIHKNFPTFQHCCYNLNDFCKSVPHAQPMTESIFKYCNLDLNQKNVIQGRYENYNKSVMSMFSQLNLFKPKNIYKINPSADYHEINYDSSMKEMVYRFYIDDFSFFQYER